MRLTNTAFFASRPVHFHMSFPLFSSVSIRELDPHGKLAKQGYLEAKDIEAFLKKYDGGDGEFSSDEVQKLYDEKGWFIRHFMSRTAKTSDISHMITSRPATLDPKNEDSCRLTKKGLELMSWHLPVDFNS